MLNNLNLNIDTMVQIFIASSVIMGAWQWFAPSSIMQVHFVHDFNQMCNMNHIISNLCEKLTWLASTNGTSNVIIAYMTYVIHSMPKNNYKKRLSLAIIALHLHYSFQTFSSVINVHNNSNSMLNVMLMSVYTFIIGVVVKMFILDDMGEKQKQKMMLAMDEMNEVMEHYPYIFSLFSSRNHRSELATSRNLNVHTHLDVPPPPVNTPLKSPRSPNSDSDFRLPDAAQNTPVATSEECISLNNLNSVEYHESEDYDELVHEHLESKHNHEHHHEHDHEHLDEHHHDHEHLESKHNHEHHHEHEHDHEHLDKHEHHESEHEHEHDHLDKHEHHESEHEHEHLESEHPKSNCVLV